MSLIAVIVGLAILAFAIFQIRNGAVQKEIAPFIPELTGMGSPTSIATFHKQREDVFAGHGVTDVKKKRALTNYARIIAKNRITPPQNEMIANLLKQNQIFSLGRS